MTSSIRVRNAERIYPDTIARLHAESYRAAFRGMLSDEYLDNHAISDRLTVWKKRVSIPEHNQRMFVAEEIDGTLVGFAYCYGGKHEKFGTFLDSLHVAPKHNRKGIGTMLIAHAALWNKSAYPEDGLWLWVRARNTSAIRFYERLGGMFVERSMIETADGSSAEMLRVFWPNMDKFTSLQ